jgi:hypothetical protein
MAQSLWIVVRTMDQWELRPRLRPSGPYLGVATFHLDRKVRADSAAGTWDQVQISSYLLLMAKSNIKNGVNFFLKLNLLHCD